MNVDADEDGFEKRRRNVIVVSLALLGAMWANATVPKLSILGIEAQPPVTLALATYLWPLWLYFAWRYLQVFSADKVFTPIVIKAENLMQDDLAMIVKRSKAFPEKYDGREVLFSRSTFPTKVVLPGIVFLSGLPTWKAYVRVEGNARVELGERALSRWQAASLMMRAAIHHTFVASTVADHLLPWGVAFLPVACLLVSLLSGSPQPELLNR